ncbi:uncharacterized protein LOC121378894 isoform X2 [Gigantopelta aegis]|uniref:uncharacterized protein LOC121378894 isoform X2 n=1 Tax=Gigantopelta aegis TaxID=1735272 RepID=UPI001B88E779|nr:uncharacterized protein LOC121378894 isoform X2 [Gigantopelta aegis]
MFTVIPLIVIATVHLSNAKIESLPPKEVYCMGCEYMVKALERILSVPSADFMDVRVVEALGGVCIEESFTSADFSPDLLVKSCEYLLDGHSDIIEPLLIGHYVRHDRPSYMELVQQICIDLTKACPGVSPEMNAQNADSRVFIDRGTNQFEVKPGDNIKISNPVKESKEDL